MVIAKVFKGKKFMWDGNHYNTEQEAQKIICGYREEGFETEMATSGDKYDIYTRRIVKEVTVAKK